MSRGGMIKDEVVVFLFCATVCWFRSWLFLVRLVLWAVRVGNVQTVMDCVLGSRAIYKEYICSLNLWNILPEHDQICFFHVGIRGISTRIASRNLLCHSWVHFRGEGVRCQRFRTFCNILPQFFRKYVLSGCSSCHLSSRPCEAI